LTCGSVARLGFVVALGVLIQISLLLFALWYGDALNFLFCESSFLGAPACPDARPGRRLILYGIPMLGIVLGGILPGRLISASWRKTALLFVITPIVTAIVVLTPLAIVIALIRIEG